MKRLCTTIWQNLAIVLLLCGGATTTMADTPVDRDTPHIDLAVSFDQAHGVLRGTCKVTLPPGHDLSLQLNDLTVTGALLSRPGRENREITIGTAVTLPISQAPHRQTVLLSYEKQVGDGPANSITPEAIILTSRWHPLPNHPVTFSLSAQVPPGFSAISESDELKAEDDSDWTAFSFSQPVFSIHFAAAPYSKRSRTVRDGLTVFTYFLPEEQGLAEDYLDAAVDYLRRYERQIGVFPYRHYVIAENTKPTGIGLPTFTLLGRQVIRLPFIKHSSLGHEILHSWFGNSIEVAAGSGNWAEGLTTYLADMAYREEAGEGAAARKQAITTYLSYVKPSTAPLRSFRGAGHDRLHNRSQRAVGYTRSAMLFHELRQRLGTQLFNRTISRFYREFRNRSASWDDVRVLFEDAADRSLARFFNERLDRTDLPDLTLKDIRVSHGAERTTLAFTIVQQQEAGPYELLLPVSVVTLGGTTTERPLLTETETRIALQLDSEPLELLVDPAYDAPRVLSPAERVPAWSRIMGSDNVLVVLADSGQRQVYAPFFQLAQRFSWPVVAFDEIAGDALTGKDLIFLGTTGAYTRNLFGRPETEPSGFSLDVRFHPVYPEQLVVLISSSAASETEAAAHRLSHYGTASFLHFQQGVLVDRAITPTENGIRRQLQEKPAGLALAELTDFDRLVEQLHDYRVIYIGETHTSRADHLLQSLLIEALQQRDGNLAIGMEMFPASSQPALDRYISDPTFEEADFLRESEYFQVWGYDYRLLRPLFALARKHRIPVVALNIERGIVSTVYSGGGIEALSDRQRAVLPGERSLDLPGYRDRLATVHAHHADNREGQRSLESFIEAQALWDETMAEAIHDYLIDHPETRMVVLAGSQHTRKDSGIPPRLAKRLSISQATVGNLAGQSITELRDTVDYLFFLDSDDLEPTGRIGVTLQEREEKDGSVLEIMDPDPDSPAAAAGLRTGDLLIAIDDRPIGRLDDVRIAMLDRLIGETLPLTVRRTTRDGTYQDLVLQVTLTGPDRARPHP